LLHFAGVSGFACTPRPVEPSSDDMVMLLRQPGYQIEYGYAYEGSPS
jgi:hypothetical protein